MIKSFVLVERDDKFLLIQESGRKWHGKWFLPGGKVKRGESPESAARREALEESGLVLLITGFFYVRYFSAYILPQVHLFFVGRVLSGTLKTYEDKQSIGAAWFSYDELKSLPLRGKLKSIIEAYIDAPRDLPVQNIRIIEKR